MISYTEIRQVAARLGVDPGVVEHDYVLGCFLHFLALEERVREAWAFKGGTCLSKCHFSEYRFSEDLDFTALRPVTEKSLKEIVQTAGNTMQREIGIRTDLKEAAVETIVDEYGKESFEAKGYYRGPSEMAGSPRSLRVHINRDETLVFPTTLKPVQHNYSDKSDLPAVTLPAYSLEEVFVEKLRAISGQRRFAIARDLFDLLYLSHVGANVEAAIRAFPEKCAIKGITAKAIDLTRIESRKEQYEKNWDNNLEYLIPQQLKTDFEEAWVFSIHSLRRALLVLNKITA